MRSALILLATLISQCLALTVQRQPAPTSAITADSTAIRKVVTLLEEMKVQVEKEASEDKAAYDKYMCWCKNNEEAKTEAISAAESRIEELTALLEELAAREARLNTEIAGLKQDIADDQDALASATAMRNKESEAFKAEEADLKETLALLGEAVGVLSKVQLLQRQGKGTEQEEARARSILLQFQERVKSSHPTFESELKKDLFDVLGAFEPFGLGRKDGAEGFPHRSALIKQTSSLLPWEKTEEQLGMESKSTDLEGAAAGAKSYNSRSSRIVGLLREMGDETARDLAEAQKQDFHAEVAFQNLRAAKLSEISIATEQQKSKEADLASTVDTAAKSREDRQSTADALSADEKFLSNLLKDCKVEDEEYKQRSEVRGQELVALAETLRILRADDARELFGKTISFLQLSRSHDQTTLIERATMQDREVDQAMQKIAAVAKKHKNWALVSFSIRLRLDAFTKVKAAIDKMLAELSTQQKEEYAKWEFCKSNIDSTEDDIKVGEQTKEDLAGKHQNIVNMLAALARDIESLKAEEQQMEISLKDAGEQRKEQNGVYQSGVMDQRATTNILNKALARLKQFYVTKFVQVRAENKQPGRAIAPAPDRPGDYAKSGGAGGVIQLLMKIIETSEVAEQQLTLDEQRSQALYAEFVQTTTAALEADRAAIAEKSTRSAELRSEKGDTEGLQLANQAELDKLTELLAAHHLECDYLLKYFDVRQQARAEEMDALTDAKAVLSGADFAR